MSALFSYLVMTPDGQISGGECDFLVVPAVGGELGVQANHAKLLARVAPGELRVHRADAVEKIGVGPGVVEVRDNVVRLLVYGASKK